MARITAYGKLLVNAANNALYFLLNFWIIGQIITNNYYLSQIPGQNELLSRDSGQLKPRDIPGQSGREVPGCKVYFRSMLWQQIEVEP